MRPREQIVAILFADICDSMPIYQASGDAFALEVIARRLDGMAALAADHGGVVVRSKGDDVLCTFADPARALDAAEAMVREQDPGVPAVHVGLHFGRVIPARRDIYGDAVNVAARMLALAKPGEIVTTREVVDALPPSARSRLAPLGRRALKGVPEPLEVYSLVLDEGDATQMQWGGGATDADAPPETLTPSMMVELEHEGRTLTVREGERCLLGRAARSDLVVQDACVSREHAWIEVRAGHATLTDQSSTGTWILDGRGGHRTLRREAGALRGSGAIRLGRHPRDDQPAPVVGFRLRAAV